MKVEAIMEEQKKRRKNKRLLIQDKIVELMKLKGKKIHEFNDEELDILFDDLFENPIIINKNN